VLLQQYNFFSICPIWLPLRHFLFSTVTNSNIQTHPTLNVYPHKVMKACIIGVRSLFRQPIAPTAYYSDSPLLRQSISPTTHYSVKNGQK
jgi:hypothetical protein